MMLYDELTSLQADLEMVRALLDQTPKDMPGRLSLEAKEQDIREELKELATSAQEVFAKLKIAFEGPPVKAHSKGIEPKFAGQALAALSDYMLRFSKAKSYGERTETSSTMLVDVVRGSFGFEFVEFDTQTRLDPSPDQLVLEGAMALLSSTIHDQNESVEANEDLDESVLVGLRELLKVLDEARVTVKIETHQHHERFASSQIALAHEKIRATSMTQEEHTWFGTLAGVIPAAGRFELITTDDAQLIKGKILDARTVEERIAYYTPLVGQVVEAKLLHKKLSRPSRQTQTYTMLDIKKHH